MSKRKRERKEKSYSSDSEEMMRMLKVVGIVVLTLVAFYLVFAIARGEISFGGKKKKEETVEIQNKEILAGSIFTRSQSEYYVLMYDFKAGDASVYENLYNMYASSSINPIYLVDLSNGFNKDYVVEDKTKVNISSIENLKVVHGTLITVKNGKGTSVDTDPDAIRKTLLNE